MHLITRKGFLEEAAFEKGLREQMTSGMHREEGIQAEESQPEPGCKGPQMCVGISGERGQVCREEEVRLGRKSELFRARPWVWPHMCCVTLSRLHYLSEPQPARTLKGSNWLIAGEERGRGGCQVVNGTKDPACQGGNGRGWCG